MAFDEVVRARRRRLGITQEELADLSGLSVRSIRDIETRRVRAPRPATVRLLADALGLDDADRQLVRDSAGTVPGGPDRAPVPALLPADVPDFTGRMVHLTQLDRLLAGGTPPAAALICAASGAAGVGVTSLAVHWAHQVRDLFPDGQLYVDLRGDADAPGTARPVRPEPRPGPATAPSTTGSAPMSPAEAIRGFLDAFGVPAQRIPAGLPARIGLYRSLLAGRRVLVVLDNARDAEQVRPLLPGSPTCRTVVTSRHQLAGLVATDGALPLTLDRLTTGEARQLLAGRLGECRAAADLGAVDQIIVRCDRLPLALAMVAARAAAQPDLPLGTLARQLGAGQLDAPGADQPAIGRSGTGPPVRHQAGTPGVRAVLCWSYHALRPPAARLFRLLALHPGPDVAADAAASLAGLPERQVRPALAELAQAHLVTGSSPGRFRLPALLRGFAAELVRAEDSDTTRRAALRRVLDHYLHTAYAAARLLDPARDPLELDPPAAGAMLVDPADRRQARNWLGAEHPVLMAAVERAGECGFDSHVWRLAWSLVSFLERQGHWPDALASQQLALAAAQRAGDGTAQAHAHQVLARTLLRLGHDEAAAAHYRQALGMFDAAREHTGQAHTHLGLSRLCERQGRHRKALGHARQALELYRLTDHRIGQARALNAIGYCHARLGDYPPALRYCQQALLLHDVDGHPSDEAATWDSLGYAHHHLGDHQQAAACYQRAIQIYRDLGDRYFAAETLIHLGDVRHAAGAWAAADQCWQQALDLLEELCHPDAEQVRARLRQLGP